jgi:uncharacterized protein YlzI (FlbEa/FlbD family)
MVSLKECLRMADNTIILQINGQQIHVKEVPEEIPEKISATVLFDNSLRFW